jgi:hypothetical protein
VLAETTRPTPVDVLDHTDGLDGLTSRQQLFVSLCFSGLTDTEAYRQAGDCSRMSEATIGRHAYDMAHLPRVQAKLRQLQDKRDQQSTLAANLTRDWITKRIMYLADNSDKDSVKLASLIALGKHVGIDLFRETTRVERVERTPEDIDRELEAQLKSLANTIEGSARAIVTKPFTPAPSADARSRRKHKPA